MPTETLERDIGMLSTRFDRHLEIYAQNGKELSGVRSSMVNLSTDIASLATALNRLEEKVDTRFVSQDQFWPVKTIVYGIVAAVLLAVMGALVSYVVIGRSQYQGSVDTAASQAASAAVKEVFASYNVQVKK